MALPLGERIKVQRARRQWTLRELARQAEVDAAWIHRLETGDRHNISLEAAARVARALGVSVDYLAGIVDSPRPWEPTHVES
jgi:transcriptional regulator with XRE-family HTH domain